jgi:Tol biopolymer transport system component
MRRVFVIALFVVFALPASATSLPILAAHDWWPVYSPDSQYVAFTEVNGQGRIFTLKVVDTTTKRVRTLARSQTQPLPSWSADSKTIAYQSLGRIRSIGVDGSNRRDLYPGIYPAWSPSGMKLAYRNDLSLYIDGVKFAGDGVIGMPIWAPDGNSMVYTRSDGIYLLSAGTEVEVVGTLSEVLRVAWSPDGSKLAYASQGYVYVVAAAGNSKPRRIAGPFADIGPVAWAPTSDQLAYTVRGGVELSTNEPSWHTQLLVKGAAVGTSFAPASPHSDILVYSGPNLSCPGHDAIRLYESRQLAGSCAITGTPGADRIQGTNAAGDVVSAGAGNDAIRIQDHHTDRVSCGPGRDTVWADRTDRLTDCEIVHR